MSEPFIGEIRGFAFTYAPRGWMVASGQLLPLSQYSTLFAIYGTTYGGNGQTNFALPNLNGRLLLSQGQGPGLSDYVLGEQIGSEGYTLLQTEMPSHTHAPLAKTQPGAANMKHTAEAGNYLTKFLPSDSGIGTTWNTPPNDSPVLLNPQFVGIAGGNASHENRQPFLAILYCVAIAGVFPSRN